MTPPDSLTPSPGRSLLRHTLATLAYRGAKAVRDAPAGFADYRAGPTLRTPVEILAHVGDLLDWAIGLADGRHEWRDSAPRPWDEETGRFHDGLAALDQRLATPKPLGFSAEKLLQGPLADALTHVGQVANHYAARNVFADYLSRKADNTIRLCGSKNQSKAKMR